MADLLEQLAAAKTDKARQDAVMTHVIDELEDHVRDAAMTLAVPHWVDESIVTQLSDPQAEGAAGYLAALTALGLAVQQPDATWSFPRTVRDLLLRRLVARQRDRFCWLSAQYSAVFLRMEAETLATDLEGIYHALGADPQSGGRLLLGRGLLFKSEPLFQWHALERLIANAEEQDRRGVLDERCRAYIDLLRSFVQHLRQPPKDEIATLRRLRDAYPDDEVFHAETQLRLGSAELAIGEVENARATLAQALVLCERADRPYGKIEALRGLARLALRRDDYAQAASHFNDARNLADRLGLIASAAHSVKGMAEIDFLQGRYPGAESGFEQAIAQFRATGARIGEANTRVSLSQLLALQHRFGEADEHIEKAMGAYEPLRQNLGLGNCLKARGIACNEQDAPTQALEYFARADEHYAKAANQTGLAYSNLMRAAALLALDRPEEAAVSLEQAGVGLGKLGDRYGLAMVERERGLLAERMQSFDLALKLFFSAIAAFEALPNPVESAATFLGAARAAAQLGFPAGYERESLIEGASSAERIFAESRLPRRLRETQALLSVLGAVAIHRREDGEQA